MIGPRFQRLEPAAYQELLARCTVIEQDTFGEKVLRTPEGFMVKIFRRKRLLSTAMLTPYARRFVRNAGRLAARGITTVEICSQAYCPPLKRHVVIYRPVPGRTLRDALLAWPDKAPHHLGMAASFIASLHQKGVYFRSLHFGNLIVPDEGNILGLIDVADMTFRSRPLAIRLRARNFKHLMRCREDSEVVERFGCRRFIDYYLAATGMAATSNRKFLHSLHRLIPAMALEAREPEDESSFR